MFIIIYNLVAQMPLSVIRLLNISFLISLHAIILDLKFCLISRKLYLYLFDLKTDICISMLNILTTDCCPSHKLLEISFVSENGHAKSIISNYYVHIIIVIVVVLSEI